ncbi:MAG: hypothetical protein ACTHNM_01560 [Dyella sp.]|uniref:Nmad2 family putative nucleotide modification protein n=1 Tax=Dyella sp. TaxID=1869338 RepID=UPI003F805533
MWQVSSLLIYVVDRDFGFAPNPFHGSCTLATCKPRIRGSARTGDWIVGMGGSRLRATGHCIFAMRVGRILTFNQYWTAPEFRDKRPIRNGSLVMLVGDNIYHSDGKAWIQEDSHHSRSDGTPEPSNVANDTSADAVLVSDLFYYFGNPAPEVPRSILEAIGYKNGRNHRRIPMPSPGEKLVEWLTSNFVPNRVLGSPFDFEKGASRYSHATNKVSP